jgi:hypothetical protein
MNVKYGNKSYTLNPEDMITLCQTEYNTFMNHIKESKGLPLDKGTKVVAESQSAFVECCRTKYIKPMLKR